MVSDDLSKISSYFEMSIGILRQKSPTLNYQDEGVGLNGREMLVIVKPLERLSKIYNLDIVKGLFNSLTHSMNNNKITFVSEEYSSILYRDVAELLTKYSVDYNSGKAKFMKLVPSAIEELIKLANDMSNLLLENDPVPVELHLKRFVERIKEIKLNCDVYLGYDSNVSKDLSDISVLLNHLLKINIKNEYFHFSQTYNEFLKTFNNNYAKNLTTLPERMKAA